MRFLWLSLMLAALPTSAATLSQTLPNGLKVVIQEDHRAPVVVSQLWYKVGSVDEQAGKTGLSHALEHMMFKGTHTIPSGEFNRRIAALGGKNNAYTNRNETVYHENIASSKLPEVLAMEADRMHNLNFSDEDFTNEMNVIREERRLRTEDNPFGKLWEHIYLNAFTTPAIQSPVIGHMQDLHALKASDLRQWYQQWYTPNNAVLVIVGDVDAKQTLQTVRTTFGNIPSKPLPQRNHIHEPQQTEPRHNQATAITHQPIIAISYIVPKLRRLNDNMPYALSILSAILSGNSASRLDKNLVRNQKAALYIGTDYDMLSRATPLFTIAAMPSEHSNPTALQHLIEAELNDIAQHGVSKAELQRIRTQINADNIYAKDSINAQAEQIGLLESRGFNHENEAEIRQRLLAVSNTDIQAAAKLLTTTPPNTVIIQPQTQPSSH